MGEYQEIHRLSKMLDDAGIPYEKWMLYDGYAVFYPRKSKRVCDAIEHAFSDGSAGDKLEMRGLLTKEERLFDSVRGFMTAEEVFERIKNHWDKKSKED